MRFAPLRRLLAALPLAAVLAAPPLVAQPVAVDLELVLAVDVSRSVDAAEFELQAQGTAQAFRHPSVIRAIQSGAQRGIAVTYVQWAGPFLQHQSVGWTLVVDAESGAEFAERVAAAPRAFSGGGTSLSGIIDYAATLFGKGGFAGRRRVVDISGDGINNIGRLAGSARDEAMAKGITINGLAILTDMPALDAWFRDNVIGGDGAFVLAADGYDSFAQAILNKLIREIAQAPAATEGAGAAR